MFGWRFLTGAILAFMGLPMAFQPAPADGCPDAFDTAFHDALSSDVGDLTITAAVLDTRTGCEMHLNPELRLTTASAIKLHLLGATLERHEQSTGQLSPTDLARVERMIHFSHNRPPTSELYVAAGVAGMQAYGDAAGAPGISHTAVYGISRASAAELNAVALATLHDGSPGSLTTQSRAVARDVLAGVHHSQQWGISAAVPDFMAGAGKERLLPVFVVELCAVRRRIHVAGRQHRSCSRARW